MRCARSMACSSTVGFHQAMAEDHVVRADEVHAQPGGFERHENHRHVRLLLKLRQRALARSQRHGAVQAAEVNARGLEARLERSSIAVHCEKTIAFGERPATPSPGRRALAPRGAHRRERATPPLTPRRCCEFHGAAASPSPPPPPPNPRAPLRFSPWPSPPPSPPRASP